MPVPWRSGHDRHPAAPHALERRVELGRVEQRTVPGQQGDAAGSERLGADDPQRRRLRVADVLGIAEDLERRAVALARAAERDPLGPPLAGDHDHPLDQLGAGRGGQHVGEHRLDERRAPRPVEGFEEPLLGGAEALHRDDRRGSHRSARAPARTPARARPAPACPRPPPSGWGRRAPGPRRGPDRGRRRRPPSPRSRPRTARPRRPPWRAGPPPHELLGRALDGPPGDQRADRDHRRVGRRRSPPACPARRGSARSRSRGWRGRRRSPRRRPAPRGPRGVGTARSSP